MIGNLRLGGGLNQAWQFSRDHVVSMPVTDLMLPLGDGPPAERSRVPCEVGKRGGSLQKGVYCFPLDTHQLSREVPMKIFSEH